MTTLLLGTGGEAVRYRVLVDGSSGQSETLALGKLCAGELGTATVATPRSRDTGNLAGSAGLAPLFLLVPTAAGWVGYTLVRYDPAELLLVRLAGEVLHGDPDRAEVVRGWFEELGARHRAHADRLNNHRCWYVTHRAGEEIEHKFTLPPEADCWWLATGLLGAVTGGSLPGWIGEHRNEFEQWAFDNHLFAITNPPAEAGYVSFIPAADGSWIVKRKWFAADGPIRRELRQRGVRLPAPPDLSAEVHARFGVKTAWGGSFRRLRYDVNVESLTSGHGYSVMFDRCTTIGGPPWGEPDSEPPVLQQCEVEYLRSRTLGPIDDAALLAEFEKLVGWVRRWLNDRGLRPVENHYSKLSFLRDHLGHAKVPPPTGGGAPYVPGDPMPPP